MASPFPDLNNAGIAEFLRQYQLPDDERKKLLLGNMLLGIGGGLMNARRGNELGAAGSGAVQGAQLGQNAIQDARQSYAGKLKTDMGVQELLDRQKAAKSKQGVNEQLAGLFKGGNPTADMPDRAPTTENAARAPQGKPKWQIFEEAAQIALANEDVPRAKQYAELADANRPKLKDQKTLTQNGQRVVVNTYADGTTQVLPDLGPDAEKLHFADTGGMAGVGMDPYSGAQVSQGMPKTMDAAQADASKRGWAQYALSKNAEQRAAAAASGGPKAPEGYRWAADGKSMEAIPGGPQDQRNAKPEKATDQQLATGGFVDRMQFADKYISAIEKSGYTPGIGEAAVQGASAVPLIGGVLGRASGVAQGWVEPRAPQYKTAKNAWIRAKLRKESGAVIGVEEEAQEDRTFFPQPGDLPSQIKQKAALRKNVEQSMVKQARGGYQGGADKNDDPLGLR